MDVSNVRRARRYFEWNEKEDMKLNGEQKLQLASSKIAQRFDFAKIEQREKLEVRN